jgi:hypothetical protein
MIGRPGFSGGPAPAALLTAWLLCLIAELTPHFIHHLFDVDPAPECEYLAAIDHAPAAVAGMVIVPVAVPVRGQPHPVAWPRVVSLHVEAPVSRAPPFAPVGLG